MTLSAGRFQITCGKNRLFPCARGIVCFRQLCGRTLSAMADHAAPVFDVVSDRRMAAKRFGDGRWVLQILLGHGHVTRRAAIDYGELRQPDLLNSRSEVMLQDKAIWTRRNKFAVLTLIVPPLIEEIFRRRHRQRN